jgi:hypothetical protein
MPDFELLNFSLFFSIIVNLGLGLAGQPLLHVGQNPGKTKLGSPKTRLNQTSWLKI